MSFVQHMSSSIWIVERVREDSIEDHVCWDDLWLRNTIKGFVCWGMNGNQRLVRVVYFGMIGGE